MENQRKDWQLIVNDADGTRNAIEILTVVGALSPTLEQLHSYFDKLTIETVNNEIRAFQDLGWLSFQYRGKLQVVLTPAGKQVYERLTAGYSTQARA